MNSIFIDPHELIDLIYQIPSDPEAWEQFAKTLIKILDVSYVHIQAVDFTYNVLSYSHGVGALTQEFYAQAELDYLHFPASADPRWPVFLNPERQGWYQCHLHVSEDFVQSSDLYQHILLPIGLRYVASHELIRDDKLCVFWSISTSAARKPLNANELKFLDQLTVHLKRMVSIQRHMYEFSAQSIAGYALIDKLPQPIMLLNLSGQAVHSNQAMQGVLAQERFISIQDKSKLTQLIEPYARQLSEHFYHIEFLLRRSLSDQLFHERCIQMSNDRGEPVYLFLSLLATDQEKLVFGTRPLVMLTVYQPKEAAHYAQLYQIFDRFKTGVILLSENLQVFYQNTFAQRLLAQTELLGVSHNQLLKTSADVQGKLNNMLTSALHDAEKNEQHLILYSQAERDILTLQISAMDSSDLQHADHQMPKVIAVFFKQLNQKRELEAGYLKQLYQLTPSEIQICRLFANGLDLNEISEQANLTLSTVRTYLKQIYVKTHCSSQSELMKLLMSAMIE
ncbi:helix-turn-helix transcriptional regulator [Acinetobacter pragensis]|uniref:helix-turn-helix transcriptional regulator n=1 Tax=Acinetobacter pragensis TaxID=1806892 RepID=UPI00333E502C